MSQCLETIPAETSALRPPVAEPAEPAALHRLRAWLARHLPVRFITQDEEDARLATIEIERGRKQ